MENEIQIDEGIKYLSKDSCWLRVLDAKTFNELKEKLGLELLTEKQAVLEEILEKTKSLKEPKVELENYVNVEELDVKEMIELLKLSKKFNVNEVKIELSQDNQLSIILLLNNNSKKISEVIQTEISNEHEAKTTTINPKYLLDYFQLCYKAGVENVKLYLNTNMPIILTTNDTMQIKEYIAPIVRVE
jgi:hypothetical protein